MKIEKAIKHFEYRLIKKDNKGNRVCLNDFMKPSENDLRALDSILEYKEANDRKVTMENESFAKLWIHQLILFSRTGLYTADRSINVLDEILSKSVYEWCVILKNEIPMMRFNTKGIDKYPLEPKDYYNVSKLKKRNESIVKEFETELTKELKYTIEDDKIISFVNNQIARAINKFEKTI